MVRRQRERGADGPGRCPGRGAGRRPADHRVGAPGTDTERYDLAPVIVSHGQVAYGR